VDALRWKPQQFMAILEVFIQAFCLPGAAESEVVTY